MNLKISPEQPAFQPATDGNIASPCIGICQMNPDTGLCQGCFRTLDEIAAWSTASDQDKRAIWIEIEQRKEDASWH